MSILSDFVRNGASAVKNAFGTRSVDSEPDRDQVKKKPERPADKDLVELVHGRFRESQAARSSFEQKWAVALAFEQGRQWVEWDENRGGLRTLIRKEERHRYITVNLMRPLLLKNVARSTANKPDVNVVPLMGGSELDTRAADEMRAINAHYDRLFDGLGQVRRATSFAMRATTAFLKQYWDPTKTAWIPSEYDPMTGEASAFAEAPVGDICEEVVPGTDLYIDPKVRRFEDARWVIHARLRPTSEIYDRYGVLVDGDGTDNALGLLQGLIGAFVGGASYNPGAGAKVAAVYEMWEPASAKFPRGRIVVVAGRQVLRYETALPYGWIPFLPLGYQEDDESPYHRGLGIDMTPLQAALNRTISRMLERMEHDKLTVARSEGDRAGADLFKEHRHMREVFFRGSDAPNITQPPPMNAEWFSMVNLLIAQMQDIAGVHDAANGEAPSGVSAGYAIRLLQDADQTQLSPFVHEIETFCVRRAERRGDLVRLFVREPRLWGLDDQDNPDDGLGQVQMPTALQSGGQARVVVTPGSATPRSPEAVNAELKELYNMGAFGPKGSPEANRVLLKMLQRTDSAQLIEEIEAAAEEAAQAAMLQMEMADAAQQVPMSGDPGGMIE